MEKGARADFKGSRFAEGRLKLSTSCTECHRRKQKCDQKQPCRNCSRRYPPPPCVYKISKNQSKDSESPRLRTSHTPEISSKDKKTSSASTSRHASVSSAVIDPQLLLEDEPKWIPKPAHISPDTVEKFDADSYQNLLNNMVSNLSSTDLSGHTTFTGVGPSKCIRKSTDTSIEEGAAIKQEPLENLEMDRRMLTFPSAPASPHDFKISIVDPLHYLGITPTVQSAELLQAFIKLITKYVVSIDGNPTPNFYNDYWVPWSIKSPLLAHLGILAAACYQAEAQKIQPAQSAVVLRYKCEAIRLLNEMLNDSATSTCNEAIGGVVFLTVNEWYWSNHECVHAHVRGLKEMIRLRGGLDELGMNGNLRKMILLTDYQISISYDKNINFPHDVKPLEDYPAMLSTPFIRPRTKFLYNTEELGISEETATILDDIQFLLSALLRHIENDHSEDESRKLHVTAVWTRDRISALPDGFASDSPLSSDFIYKSCRIAALIYCTAIAEHKPLAKACSLSDLNRLWMTMWQIKLSRWKQIPGIFIFIILAGTPAAQDTPHGRFLKSMLKTTSSYISMDNWEVIDGVLMAFVKLQRWLRTMRSGSLVQTGAVQVKPLEFLHIYGE